MKDFSRFAATRRALLIITPLFLACSDPLPPKPAVGTILGTIRDGRGLVVAGLVVRAALSTTYQTVSAADGTFTFSALPVGQWQLRFDGTDDFESTSMPVDVTAGAATNVTMVVGRVGVIQGMIRYDDTNQPAAGVQVRMFANGDERDAVTTADGSFKFERTAAGTLSITVASPGYRDVTVPISFKGTGLTLSPITLVRVSGTILGSVKAAHGGGGVTVRLTHTASGVQQIAITTGDGSFTFAEVPVGAVSLAVEATPETFAAPAVISLSMQAASLTAPAFILLPRAALRPIAYVRCVQMDFTQDNCVRSHIVVSNSDGTGGRTVADVDDYISRPSWSPDAEKLIFSRPVCTVQQIPWGTASTCRSQLHTINVDGTDLAQLIQAPDLDMSSPMWSTDGTRILFSGATPGPSATRRLYFVNLADSSIIAVPNTEGGTGAALSPDGSRIAFDAWQNGTGTLNVVNTDGSGLITLVSGGVGGPTWSADGKTIAFAQWDATGSTVTVINTDGGNLRAVGPGACPQWSPDGSLIAAVGSGDATYANDVVVAMLPLQGALPCLHAWSPAAVLLP